MDNLRSDGAVKDLDERPGIHLPAFGPNDVITCVDVTIDADVIQAMLVIDDLECVHFKECHLTPEALERLPQLELDRLIITGGDIAIDDLIHAMTRTRSLRGLTLSECEIDSGALREVSGIPDLQWIIFWKSTLHSGALEPVFRETQIRHCQLKEATFDARDLGALADCESLEWLELTETSVGDDDIRNVANASSLQKLSVSHTRITMASLECFEGMPNLLIVYADGTALRAPSGEIHLGNGCIVHIDAE